MWVPGKWVAIDKQTLGFQGSLEMKLQISNKREEDGFQYNAVCNEGYTYSFYFRHRPPPNVGGQYKDMELSPTARRVVWLASRLLNRWTRIYMDKTCPTQRSCTRHCTGRRRWRMESQAPTDEASLLTSSRRRSKISNVPSNFVERRWLQSSCIMLHAPISWW